MDSGGVANGLRDNKTCSGKQKEKDVVGVRFDRWRQVSFYSRAQLTQAIANI